MGELATVNYLSAVLPEKTWYVLFTKPRAEKQVHDRLVQTGIEAFLPMYTTLRQWSDRKKKIEVPLFSSYVFVHISPDQYLSVLHTQGSVKYVCFGGIPAKVPEQIINNLRIALNGSQEIEVSTRNFRPGQKVKVAYGILKDLVGELIHHSSGKWLLIRIDGIGQNLLVKIPVNYITVVD
jgi:transcription antitermination factor NusG